MNVDFWSFLNHWWNVPFLVMLGLVVVFFVLQMVGLAGHKEAELHAGADADADVDADKEMDLHGGVPGMLAFFGVGRVPFLVIWLSLCIAGGFTGLALNRIVYLRGGYPWWFFFVSLAAALVVGLAAVGVAARVASRVVDTGGRGATRKSELAGRLGVASSTIDGRFGQVRVLDDGGNELLVHARICAGDPPIRQGRPVVIVDYDAEQELYSVTSSPELETDTEA
jgi:membrane protein implicated in regulation of membrane protease activity